MASTAKQTEGARGSITESSAEDIERAVELVNDADRLIFQVLRPGRWPQQRTVRRFLEGDRLGRVLALYREAMELDPLEPAYPWNLASTLNRLGLHDLALAHIQRALRVSEAIGDAEWCDGAAHVAWAEIAVNAGQYDVALVALARAKERTESEGIVDPDLDRLLGEIRRALGDERCERELAARLEALSA